MWTSADLELETNLRQQRIRFKSRSVGSEVHSHGYVESVHLMINPTRLGRIVTNNYLQAVVTQNVRRASDCPNSDVESQSVTEDWELHLLSLHFCPSGSVAYAADYKTSSPSTTEARNAIITSNVSPSTMENSSFFSPATKAREITTSSNFTSVRNPNLARKYSGAEDLSPYLERFELHRGIPQSRNTRDPHPTSTVLRYLELKK